MQNPRYANFHTGACWSPCARQPHWSSVFYMTMTAWVPAVTRCGRTSFVHFCGRCATLPWPLSPGLSMSGWFFFISFHACSFTGDPYVISTVVAQIKSKALYLPAWIVNRDNILKFQPYWNAIILSIMGNLFSLRIYRICNSSVCIVWIKYQMRFLGKNAGSYLNHNGASDSCIFFT